MAVAYDVHERVILAVPWKPMSTMTCQESFHGYLRKSQVLLTHDERSPPPVWCVRGQFPRLSTVSSYAVGKSAFLAFCQLAFDQVKYDLQ